MFSVILAAGSRYRHETTDRNFTFLSILDLLSYCSEHSSSFKLTAEFVVDLGVWRRWERPTLPTLWPVTDVFLLKKHWAEVGTCFACDIIYLFSVVFCMVRSVHKFASRLVTNKQKNQQTATSGKKFMQWWRNNVFDKTCIFSSYRRRKVQVSCLLLSMGV